MATGNFRSNIIHNTLWLEIEWIESSPDQLANTSVVTVNVTVRHGGLYYVSKPVRIKIGDQEEVSFAGAAPYTSQASTFLGTKDIIVNHNTDGSFSGNLSVTWDCDISRYGSTNPVAVPYITATSSITLDSISRLSDVTVRDFTMDGTAQNVTIIPADPSFTHQISLVLDQDHTVTVPSEVGTTSVAITVPAAWNSMVTTATVSIATLSISTYSGGQLLGTRERQVRLLVPESVAPQFTLSLNGIGIFNGLYLTGRSQCEAIVSDASSPYGGTIQNIAISGFGVSGSGADFTRLVSPVFQSSGTVACQATVTDSRGRSTTRSGSITVTAYSRPSLSVVPPVRSNESGHEFEDGTYALCKATYSCTEIEGNTASCHVEYQEYGTSTWSGSTSLVSGEETNCFGSLNTTKNYNIRYTVVDTAGGEASAVVILSQSANFLITAKKGKICLGGYVDSSLSDGLQVVGDLHVSGRNADGIEYIQGTQISSTNKFTGVTRDAALYDGKKIAYLLSAAATTSNAYLNLTLADGTQTGDIAIKVPGGGALNNHFTTGDVIIMIYTGTDWHVSAYYNANYFDRTRLTNTVVHADSSYVIAGNGIIMRTGVGTYASICQTRSTSAGKQYAKCGFYLDDILLYNNATTIAKGGSVAGSSLYTSYNLNILYSTNASSFTIGQPVYFRFSKKSDGLFYLPDTWWSQSLPTTDDGFVYVRLGLASDSSHVNLEHVHPSYIFKNGHVIDFEAYNASLIGNYTEVASQTLTSGTASWTGNDFNSFVVMSVPVSYETSQGWDSITVPKAMLSAADTMFAGWYSAGYGPYQFKMKIEKDPTTEVETVTLTRTGSASVKYRIFGTR